MFNLPLPGGTTGHAVGVAVAAIVLGPWAAMLAIAIALFVQAVFFGDGGITTFGANCLNMAIVGPVIAYWTITWQGLRSAGFLIGRAETATTYALLVILTTPWPRVLKALRCLGLPLVLIVILGMTHRYIFLLLTSAIELFEAQRSRLMAPMSARERRRLAAASAVVLLEKALRLSTEVHLAMIARGYRDEVHLLDDFRTRPADWLALAGAFVLAAAALGLQWLPIASVPVPP